MGKALDQLELGPGKVFTFSFWCIAQFVDAIGWKAPKRGIIPESRLNDLGTHPPCYIVMYSLKPREQWQSVHGPGDERHLDSRKSYCMRLGMWSSLLPASAERARELMAIDETP